MYRDMATLVEKGAKVPCLLSSPLGGFRTETRADKMGDSVGKALRATLVAR